MTKRWNQHLSEDEDYGGLFADLDEEGLDTLPRAILENLQISSLDLTNNNFKEFPNEIAGMENLKYVDLSGNPIGSLPENLAANLNLKAFVFYESSILSLEDVVRFVSKMPSLESFCYSYKKEESLDDIKKHLEETLDAIEEERLSNMLSLLFALNRQVGNVEISDLKLTHLITYTDYLRSRTGGFLSEDNDPQSLMPQPEASGATSGNPM